MTNDELDTLDRALTALTPAPWSRDPDTDPENADAVITDGLHPFLNVQCGEGAVEEADAIVALRNAAPELLAGVRELERLKEERKRLGEAWRAMGDFDRHHIRASVHAAFAARLDAIELETREVGE